MPRTHSPQDEGSPSTNLTTPIRYTHVERFAPGDPQSVRFLDDQGYVVIRNALTEPEAAHAVELFWQYLEDLGTGIDRSDHNTWGNDRWPTHVHGGLLPSYGIGHSAAQWFIRGVPAVKQSFAAIWDTDDLLVSFDGVAVWRPWTLNPEWKTDRGGAWLHIDQHPIGRPGKQCVQGVVNLLPTTAKTGGNVVVPGSHKHFHEIPERYAKRLSNVASHIDHFRYPADDPLLANADPIIAHLDPGDMLMWDSRTIHCSSPGLETPDATPEILRMASLVAMMPRAKSSPEVIQTRKEAVGQLVSTTNWTDCLIKADEFEPIVAAENRDRWKWPAAPELTEYQLKMVGWTEEELRQR